MLAMIEAASGHIAMCFIPQTVARCFDVSFEHGAMPPATMDRTACTPAHDGQPLNPNHLQC
ncbi:hypothetical protein AF72_12175 [Xylella taiwanensis]|uniref:Uncharacterized protein n=1 Tax=Xylella taiwanensis TaxID=1444770 RepID=Z9JG68_9GAMM|nr:hypothetical protein AB672_03990 [Xylella taiwanensis]EWS77174.1 hypothetical protein AF72_12175 [Xylella taiwanensis]